MNMHEPPQLNPHDWQLDILIRVIDGSLIPFDRISPPSLFLLIHSYSRSHTVISHHAKYLNLPRWGLFKLSSWLPSLVSGRFVWINLSRSVLRACVCVCVCFCGVVLTKPPCSGNWACFLSAASERSRSWQCGGGKKEARKSFCMSKCTAQIHDISILVRLHFRHKEKKCKRRGRQERECETEKGRERST